MVFEGERAMVTKLWLVALFQRMVAGVTTRRVEEVPKRHTGSV
jgi:hypothetical protein